MRADAPHFGALELSCIVQLNPLLGVPLALALLASLAAFLELSTQSRDGTGQQSASRRAGRAYFVL